MRRATRPIYGISKRKADGPGTPCSVCPDISAAFVALESFIYKVQETIGEFFPASLVVSRMIAEMSARASVPPPIFVRLAWLDRHNGEPFDVDNVLNRLQIKTIYLEYGLDHTRDPLFKDTLGLTLV
jgi:hypothetical protein